MFLVSIRTLGARDKRYIGYARKMSNCSTARVASLLLKYHNMRVNFITFNPIHPVSVRGKIVCTFVYSKHCVPCLTRMANAVQQAFTTCVCSSQADLK